MSKQTIMVRHPDKGHQLAANACNWASVRDGEDHWDTFAVSSDISNIVQDEDLLPYENAAPELRENSSVAFPIKNDDLSHSVVLYFIEGFGKWFALKQGTSKCGYCKSDREVYRDAALLNDYCRKKLLEGFNIPEDTLSLDKVDHTPPVNLKLMAKYQCDVIRIVFHTGYYETGDDSSPQSVVIPAAGDLPDVNEEFRAAYKSLDEIQTTIGENKFVSGRLEQSPFTPDDNQHVAVGVEFDITHSYNLMQLRWIEKRGEWVALAYELRVSGDEHYESYAGPFALDDYCSQVLLKAYGIPAGRVDLRDVPNLYPLTLETIAEESELP